ncbi:hypothetical protein DNHGIG_21250 [Collibacillus ludicampi]|uniref:N-acetyltransferase domain-containing protein n=1 Tax=Collibacillus ludicampi TaxID=2771369 RepID=A0AAV4LFH1_9BACL|nr:GNAT family N-acetyltransferase [Collibacillus ludicampi]GIM46576.1 hypothetical protein DNHGIG_21250 [Collibacillus ludicampi]
MITIKRLSECTFEQGVQAWNDAFKGYFFDVTTSVDAFTARLGREGLSPALSIVAFIHDQPVGLVLSGVRIIDGKKVAWNGGTGVAPQFRGQGIGKVLMEAALKIYQDEKVDIATLEALSQNEGAIKLYRKMGYKITDRLLFFYQEGTFANVPFMNRGNPSYQIKSGIPQDVRTLSFYKGMYPWQCQWQSLSVGKSDIVLDANGGEVGYVLYTKTCDESGKPTRINLFQCEAKPGREDADDILRCLLAEVYAPFDASLIRGTFNLPASNNRVVKLLKEAGFTIKTEQVMMKRTI